MTADINVHEKTISYKSNSGGDIEIEKMCGKYNGKLNIIERIGSVTMYLIYGFLYAGESVWLCHSLYLQHICTV